MAPCKTKCLSRLAEIAKSGSAEALPLFVSGAEPDRYIGVSPYKSVLESPDLTLGQMWRWTMRKAILVAVSVALLVSWTNCFGQGQPSEVPKHKFEITDCSVPYQANTVGATYTVTQDLNFGGGSEDCIDVTASGITINLNGHFLSAVPCGCTGISISKGANGVHIFGGSIGGRGPNYGIHDMGDAALIENITVGSQSTAGIFLDAVRGSVVNNVSVSSNFGRGGAIQLLDTDHCLVENSRANHNGYPPCGEGEPCGGSVSAGIWVGNSGSQDLSKNNFVVGNEANDNIPFGIWVGGTGNVVTSNNVNGNNYGGEGGGWGIFAAATGFPGTVNNNLVINNSALQNEVDDVYDSNAECGTDHWLLNSFKTRNEGCIH
jgi:hypothetical protein